MGWRETGVLEEREKFCIEVLRRHLSMSSLCEIYGISRVTGYKWLERWKEDGRNGLVDLPRRPRTHPNAIGEDLQRAIVEVRIEHPTWGPKKIAAKLEARFGSAVPAISTVGEILKRNGLVVERRKRHRTPSYTQPLAHCEAANQVWCADFKGWFLTGDGKRCDPLTITDGASRYLLRCQAVDRTDESHVRAVFESLFRECGMPEAIRTDNGSPFATRAVKGLSRLSVWWLKLGIVPERIEPGHPEQNGRHERMHLTLKRETATPPARTAKLQQQAFDHFREEYNNERPHEALGQTPPAQHYAPSPRPFPARLKPFEYDSDILVRNVRLAGEIKWRYRRIGISRALVGERVGLREVADGIWEVLLGPVQLGWIDERKLRRVAPRKFGRLEHGCWK
jgi:putative transposase